MTISELHLVEKIFEHSLPGRVAHGTMARNLGRENIIPREDARNAAVMILLFPNNHRELEIVFTERAVTNVNDSHSGQMSFPGGKYDDSDIDLMETALRETREEIGVVPEKIQILGKITPLYIPVSNFLAHPFVGFIDHQPQFIKEEREVAEIITSPISYLLDYREPSSMDMNIRQGLILKNVPYFDIKGKVVWGATSMILNEFLIAVRDQLNT